MIGAEKKSFTVVRFDKFSRMKKTQLRLRRLYMTKNDDLLAQAVILQSVAAIETEIRRNAARLGQQDIIKVLSRTTSALRRSETARFKLIVALSNQTMLFYSGSLQPLSTWTSFIRRTATLDELAIALSDDTLTLYL